MSGLDGLFAASHYDSPLLSYAIHSLKYRYLEALAEPLGIFLARRLETTGLELPELIVPVPLHKKRLRQRGFNQSERIAEHLVRHLVADLALSVDSLLLERIRATKPQMKTSSKEERLSNLAGAFAVPAWSRARILGTRLWIVDDVSTTGAPLKEALVS